VKSTISFMCTGDLRGEERLLYTDAIKFQALLNSVLGGFL